MSFDEAWRERELVEIDGLTLPILGRAQLIENKQALGRKQDQADIDRLIEDDTTE